MINIEGVFTVVANEFEQIHELERVTASVDPNKMDIILIGNEEVYPEVKLLETLLKGQPITAVILGQVVEVTPRPQMITDFYRRPHQQGIQHGPYPPLDSGDMQAQALHQLEQHSRALGTAWFKHKISNESAGVIDAGIKQAIEEVQDT